MDQSKRVSLWSVQEVLEWVEEQYPTQVGMLHKAIIKHAISGTADGFNVIEDPEIKKCSFLYMDKYSHL